LLKENAPIVHESPGDFNLDSRIDKADHDLWRGTFGQSGEGLAADGNEDGVVNAADFVNWRNRSRPIVVLDSVVGSVQATRAGRCERFRAAGTSSLTVSNDSISTDENAMVARGGLRRGEMSAILMQANSLRTLNFVLSERGSHQGGSGSPPLDGSNANFGEALSDRLLLVLAANRIHRWSRPLTS
jgi:hypothetical protein